MNPQIRDLRGQIFGKWKPIQYFRKGHWICECECGTMRAVNGSSLKRGLSKSCGLCMGIQVDSMPEHESWAAMRARCEQKTHMHYARYGGRGISICERWKTFANFYEDMGKRPEGKSLDRIDTDGNYEPANCRWSTQKEQANNTSKNRRVEYRGSMMTISEIADLRKEKYTTVYNRLVRKAKRNEVTTEEEKL